MAVRIRFHDDVVLTYADLCRLLCDIEGFDAEYTIAHFTPAECLNDFKVGEDVEWEDELSDYMREEYIDYEK